MIDLVRLLLKAGDGGYGRISFRREKFVTHGGPDGGNGGEGGQIIIRATRGINTLRPFAGIKQIKAVAGAPGARRKMSGVKGETTIIEVPVGTVVWLVGENEASKQRTQRYGVRQLLSKAELPLEKFYVEKEQQPAPYREPDAVQLVAETFDEYRAIWKVTGALPIEKTFANGVQGFELVAFTEPNQEVVICQGGFGGKGNFMFRGSTNVTPLEAEYGSFGEQKDVILELQLLADVGLVGLPNAGKSTLLSKITRAMPKIGDYPFTTIEPNLGVLTVDKLSPDFATLGNKSRRDIVIADIPGLIEGASEGKGLGLDFLRHIENCRRLVYVLSLPEAVVFDDTLNVTEKAAAVWAQYQLLKQELAEYSHRATNRDTLLQKPYILTLNKVDIYSNQLIDAIIAIFTHNDEEILAFSGVTGQGLDMVIKALLPLGETVTAEHPTETPTAQIAQNGLETAAIDNDLDEDLMDDMADLNEE